MSYAIISVGGKQHRVREGERLLVDRLSVEEGKTFHPEVLLIAGDGAPLLGATELTGQQVTARVTGHVLGKKVIVGKHKQRTGYRRRNGMRARLTAIEIESIGKKATRAAAAKPSTRASAPRAAAGTKKETASVPATEPKAAPKRAARKPKPEPDAGDAALAKAPRRSTRAKPTDG